MESMGGATASFGTSGYICADRYCRHFDRVVDQRVWATQSMVSSWPIMDGVSIAVVWLARYNCEK